MAKTNVSGKWRITEMDLWDREAIDEEIVAGSGPGEKPSFLEGMERSTVNEGCEGPL